MGTRVVIYDFHRKDEVNGSTVRSLKRTKLSLGNLNPGESIESIVHIHAARRVVTRTVHKT